VSGEQFSRHHYVQEIWFTNFGMGLDRFSLFDFTISEVFNHILKFRFIYVYFILVLQVVVIPDYWLTNW